MTIPNFCADCYLWQARDPHLIEAEFGGTNRVFTYFEGLHSKKEELGFWLEVGATSLFWEYLDAAGLFPILEFFFAIGFFRHTTKSIWN